MAAVKNRSIMRSINANIFEVSVANKIDKFICKSCLLQFMANLTTRAANASVHHVSKARCVPNLLAVQVSNN